MNSIAFFLLEVVLTFAICGAIFIALRPYLRKILIDLCGTEERAQFWTIFSSILLVGFPLLIALTFQPQGATAEELFFEIARRLSGNLLGFMFTLVGVGLIVSFFALTAPRSGREEK